MLKVKRHLFVPEQYIDSAYADNTIPLEKVQTVSQPYMVALMTELLNPLPGKKVSDIRTGSGYQTAVLAKSGCDVYTIEIIPELSIRVRDILYGLRYTNIKFKIGDGYKGWEENATYEAITVTAAPKEIPDKLIDQLSLNSKLIIPVGGPSQDLFL